MRGFWFTTICSLLLLSSCNNHLVKGSGTPTESPGALDSQATVSAPLVQQSVLGICLRCHGGNTLPNLSSIDSIMANIGPIQNEVNSNQMPPPGSGMTPLTDCQKDILQEWVAEGMPAQSTHKVSDLTHCQTETPVPTPPPPVVPILESPLNYQTLATQILQPRCLHCHSSGSSDPDASKILLYPYSELMAHKKWFSSTPANSKFFNLISRTDDNRMPPPEDSNALSSDEIEFVRRWMNAGHPEN